MEKEIPHEVDAHEGAASAYHNAQALGHTSEICNTSTFNSEGINHKKLLCYKKMCNFRRRPQLILESRFSLKPTPTEDSYGALM